MKTERQRILFALILIAFVTVLAYFPSLQNGFTNWDDNHMVTENFMIRSLSPANIVHIFFSMHYGHYHPLVVLSYAAEFHFFRLDPWIYHFTNLLLHVVNTLLVFWFIRSLRGGLVVPLMTALLFGVHPLHVESVAWITERKDVLYTMFFLLSMISYVRYVQTRKISFFVLTFAMFLCSVLSKAMAITLPFVLLLLDYLLHRKYDKSVLIEKFPLIGTSFLFGIIMLYATYSDKSQVAGASLGIENFLVAFHGLLFYPLKFLYPVTLSSLYPYPGKFGSPLPLEYTAAPFLVIAILAGIVWSMRKNRLPFFCAAFFIITVAPVLQLTMVGGVIAADRFVYVPMIGLAFALAEFIAWGVEKPLHASRVAYWLVSVMFAMLILALGVRTWNQTRVWKDSVTLWNNVLNQYTGVTAGYNNRGLAFAERREFKQAIDDYSYGLSLEPDDWKLHLNRGNALRELGAYPQAFEDYNKAISEFPTNPDIYYNRGLVYQYLNNPTASIDDYSQCLRLFPYRLEALVNRGTVYGALKKYDKALQDFDTALKLYPDDADTYFNRGFTYRALGRNDSALTDFSQALVLEPNNAKTLNYRGMTYFGLGEFDKAIADYNTAMTVEPSSPILFNNRGAAYYQKREFEKAIADYNVALSLAPNYAEAVTNRAFAWCASANISKAREDIAKLRTLGAWIDPRLLELTSPGK